MPDPLLSVHLLAKNEASNLPDAIASVRDIADEVVVTDTGSEDDTPELAAKLGARVEHFAWCDDFAAGWNHGVAACRGDWVLILDADERLMDHSVDPLRRAVQRLDAQRDAATAAVLRRDLADADDLTRYTKMAQLRLIRRAAWEGGLRFVGRCHPQPRGIGQAAPHRRHAGLGPPPLLREIELLHHGYLPALRPAKQQRGARLLELELAARPEGPRNLYYRIERVRTLLLLGDPRAGEALSDAATRLGRHVDDPAPPLQHASLLLEVLLQWPADRLPEPWTPQKVREVVRRWFPQAPPLLWLLAGQAFAAGDHAAAAADLERLVAMGRDHSYPAYTGFDPAIIGEEAAINLAASLIKLSRLDEARGVLAPLERHERVGPQARANLETLATLMSERGDVAPQRMPRSRRRRRRSSR